MQFKKGSIEVDLKNNVIMVNSDYYYRLLSAVFHDHGIKISEKPKSYPCYFALVDAGVIKLAITYYSACGEAGYHKHGFSEIVVCKDLLDKKGCDEVEWENLRSI